MSTARELRAGMALAAPYVRAMHLALQEHVLGPLYARMAWRCQCMLVMQKGTLLLTYDPGAFYDPESPKEKGPTSP